MRETLKAFLQRRGKRLAIAGALEAAAVLSRAGLVSGARGHGVIFTLHHVRPPERESFAANRHLEVTPEFLDRAIAQLRDDGYDFIALSEIPARLRAAAGKTAGKTGARPFAAFTLDDGYRNNAEHALPVFERHGVPFTIFVTRGFAERTHSLWWETLGTLFSRLHSVRFDFGEGVEVLDLSNEIQTLRAFDRFAQFVASGDEEAAVARIDTLAREHGIDPLAITADLVMDTEELQRTASHPLASLGAHTLSHRALARLSPEEALCEMQQSADWVEELTGKRPPSLAYPYGFAAAVSRRDTEIAQEAGFSVAVTTQPGTIGAQWMDRLTGLPRVSLNGHYQKPRYVSALASGIPFALSRR